MLHLYLLSLIVFALVLHLYLLEHGGVLILKKFLVLMLHLYYFESLLEQHGIFYGYKVGLRMMSIQVGYNKNYHRKRIGCYDQLDA